MRNLLLILLTLSLLSIAGGTVARAQVIAAFKAHIPFGFTVGNTRLPAGSYTIRRHLPGLMEIRSAEGNRAVLFSTRDTNAAKTPEQAELIFNQLGDRYFLSKLFNTGNGIGAELQKSHAERRLKKEMEAIEVTVRARNDVNAKH